MRKQKVVEPESDLVEVELTSTTEEEVLDGAIKLPTVEILKMKNQLIFPTGNISFKFRTERSGSVPLPVAVKIIQQGGESFRLDFFYKTNGAPRTGHGGINMEIFDRSSFIIQTGVDERTGKPIGKAFSKLVCIASLHNTIPGIEERLEQLTCLTEDVVDWDSKQVTASTMAPVLQVKR